MPSGDYAPAINRLHNEIGQDQRLKRAVIMACEAAKTYLRMQDDPNKSARSRDSLAIKDLEGQAAAIAALSAFVRSYPRQAGLALAGAGYMGRRKEAPSQPVSESFLALLSEYAAALPQFTQRGGPWLHRFQRANLIFAGPIDHYEPGKAFVATGLLFELVAIFRSYTAGEDGFEGFQSGQTMPKDGKPHYELAADFVAIATGEIVGNPKLRLLKFIRENPGVGLMPWPKPDR